MPKKYSLYLKDDEAHNTVQLIAVQLQPSQVDGPCFPPAGRSTVHRVTRSLHIKTYMMWI